MPLIYSSGISSTVPDVGEILVILAVSYEKEASEEPAMEARVTFTVLRRPTPIPDLQTVDESESQVEYSQAESPKRTLWVTS